MLPNTQEGAHRCPINNLPTELLSYIFLVGCSLDDCDDADSEWTTDSESDAEIGFDSTDKPNGSAENVPLPDSPPMEVLDVESVDEDDLPQLPFQVLVSQVCKRWRDVAIDESPMLWTKIDFSEGPPFEQSKAWLERSKGCPLDIDIDCQPPEEIDENGSVMSEEPSPSLSIEELEEVLHLLCPHVARLRAFQLMVHDYSYMHRALQHLAQIPAAPLLEVLQLYHYEDSDEYDAFQPVELREPRFLPFCGNAPRLRTVSLWGVHLDWAAAGPLLAGLAALELAWTAQDVRPTFAQLAALFRGSPELQELTLCQSGPAGTTEAEWLDSLLTESAGELSADETKLVLPSVTSFVLAFQEPEYAAALLRWVFVPNVRELALDFYEDDYTVLAAQLLAADAHYGPAPRCLLSGLENLKLSGLVVPREQIPGMLVALAGLRHINLNLYHIDPLWLALLAQPISRTQRLLGLPSGEGFNMTLEDIRPVASVEKEMYCPKLEHISVRGFSDMRLFLEIRTKFGAPLKRVSLCKDEYVPSDDERAMEGLVEELDYFEGSDDDDEVVEIEDPLEDLLDVP